MAPRLALPYGFKDAKVILLVQAIIGEFLQGKFCQYTQRSIVEAQAVGTSCFRSWQTSCNLCWGGIFACIGSLYPPVGTVGYTCNIMHAGGLIFGWNALALMLKAQGNYNRNCTQPISGKPIQSPASIEELHHALVIVLTTEFMS